MIYKISRNNQLQHYTLKSIQFYYILFYSIIYKYLTTKNHSILQKQQNIPKHTFIYSYYSIFILDTNINSISYTIQHLLHITTNIHISYSFHTI